MTLEWAMNRERTGILYKKCYNLVIDWFQVLLLWIKNQLSRINITSILRAIICEEWVNNNGFNRWRASFLYIALYSYMIIKKILHIITPIKFAYYAFMTLYVATHSCKERKMKVTVDSNKFKQKKKEVNPWKFSRIEKCISNCSFQCC